jgi:hypothetical protein
MNTEKEPRHELFELTTVVENTLIKLKKAKLLLDDWTQEYGFCENPTPHAAIAWGAKKASELTRTEKDSVKWYWEYEKIFGFIEIVHDYIYESQQALENVLKQEGAA